ncbi:hypothetical protein ACHAWF_000687 [Thalassiosira exigua]
MVLSHPLTASSRALAIRLVAQSILGGVGSRFSAAAGGSRPPEGEDDPSEPRRHQRQRARRRIRRKTAIGVDGSGAGEEGPSLADFVHRAKVLKQYRSFVRLARFVDAKDASASEAGEFGGCRAALEEVRLSFKMGMKKDVDALARSMALSEGERRLRELEAMVGYSTDRALSDETSNDADAPKVHDADSWINTPDKDDPRGRVGVQWPWE